MTGAFTALALAALVNPDYEPGRRTIATEKAIRTDEGRKHWEAARSAELRASCDTQQIWKTTSTKIRAGHGSVKRALAYLFVSRETGNVLAGQGVLDLTSWSSKDTQSARRVQRHLFQVETPEGAVSELSFTLDPDFKLPAQGQAEAKLDADLKLGGKRTKASFPVTVTRVSPLKLRIATREAAPLTYVRDEDKPRLLALMKEANVRSIPTTVPVTFDLSFVNRCGK